MQGLHLLAILFFAFVSTISFAYDPSPLQDFCVGTNMTTTVFVNGEFCKDPNSVTSDDFVFHGLNIPRPTNNPLGSTVTPVTVVQFPALNTLGISLARIDYGPYGLNPPHTHPRGTEILVVLEGTLLVGFVTSNPPKLFTTTLKPGDVFVFPIGLIHFQLNIDTSGNAIALAALSGQNPGVIPIANSIFGSSPLISADVLTKAFQLDNGVVDYLEHLKWWDNN